MKWLLSSSSDPRALAVVDGTGPFSGHGPHYSRRTPGSKTFTGIGREIVLVTECGRAVWAVVYQRTPSPRFVWRNMLFRNLGAGLSSELIASALATTYTEWARRYGGLPSEALRTEIGVGKVRSKNPGCCYKIAGWHSPRVVRGKLYLTAPRPPDPPRLTTTPD
jgi:hypothetical protein